MLDRLKMPLLAIVLLLSAFRQARSETFTWNFANDFGQPINIELYSIKRQGHVWPGNGVVWTLPSNGVMYSNPINCERREKILLWRLAVERREQLLGCRPWQYTSLQELLLRLHRKTNRGDTPDAGAYAADAGSPRCGSGGKSGILQSHRSWRQNTSLGERQRS